MSITPIFSGRTYKVNESITSCQDYFQTNEMAGCFAIADGASRSFYPGIWAELLVNQFCQNPEISQENWKTWLCPIREKWLLEIEDKVAKAKSEKKPTWVTSQNRLTFREPATSTFIGLQITADQVKVCIVGDSCLFILNGNQLQTYLLQSSKDFSDRSKYLASYVKDDLFQPQFLNMSLDGKNEVEEIFFILATDALSEYIFKCLEHKTDIFQTLLKISSQNEFEDFVSSARNSDNVKMKNDDVTLMTLALDNKNTRQLYKETGNEAQSTYILVSTSESTTTELKSDQNGKTAEEKSGSSVSNARLPKGQG